MRRFFAAAIVTLIFAGLASAQTTGKGADSKDKDKASAEKDSPAMAKTRKLVSEATIDLDCNDDQLDDVMKNIKGQVEGVNFHLENGVPRQKRITYKCEKKLLKEALEELGKKYDLGFDIHRKEKENDRYEGWIAVKVGFDGSSLFGKAPDKKDDKGKTTAKPPAGGGDKTAKPAEAAGDDEKAEKAAASKLKQAKLFLDEGQKADAKDYCNEILKKYPKTKAAEEAKQLLEKIK